MKVQAPPPAQDPPNVHPCCLYQEDFKRQSALINDEMVLAAEFAPVGEIAAGKCAAVAIKVIHQEDRHSSAPRQNPDQITAPIILIIPATTLGACHVRSCL